MSTFAERFKGAKEKSGKSTKDVAESIGVTSQAIWNYENREYGGVQSDLLFPLADFLGVSARWLATGNDDGVVRPIDPKMHPAIAQSVACLEAFLAGNSKSVELVKAALTILQEQKSANN